MEWNQMKSCGIWMSEESTLYRSKKEMQINGMKRKWKAAWVKSAKEALVARQLSRRSKNFFVASASKNGNISQANV